MKKPFGNFLCISGDYYATYASSKIKGIVRVLRVHSPEPLDGEFVEFMRNNPDKVRNGESPPV